MLKRGVYAVITFPFSTTLTTTARSPCLKTAGEEPKCLHGVDGHVCGPIACFVVELVRRDSRRRSVLNNACFIAEEFTESYSGLSTGPSPQTGFYKLSRHFKSAECRIRTLICLGI
ncbi:hypothetical protein Q8A67_000944 [Cirrhinus molitorella]|uniref:Uncharacterized protein n=1 Tax=Cirrhinus molitorella TaxID=172907 RepID=A0AA88U0M5_9TELE|nr:hypothetical protein Q8A67_000944 [Cirrhinus molitorella]